MVHANCRVSLPIPPTSSHTQTRYGIDEIRGKRHIFEVNVFLVDSRKGFSLELNILVYFIELHGLRFGLNFRRQKMMVRNQTIYDESFNYHFEIKYNFRTKNVIMHFVVRNVKLNSMKIFHVKKTVVVEFINIYFLRFILSAVLESFFYFNLSVVFNF